LWSRALGTDPAMAFCSTPLWDPKNQILVISGAYGYGATALHLSLDGKHTRVDPLWRDNKLQSLFANLVLLGDTMYLSRGFSGPAFLTAVDIVSGKTKWATREFARATFIAADGKLVILDEHGWLALAQRKPDGSLEIGSRFRAVTTQAWTIPTVADGTLYLRDRAMLMAFRVGRR
jgi:hypothetical protein